jgi:hypothetical protein
MMAGMFKTRKNCRLLRSKPNRITGRPEWTRTIDLFRVNFEVIDLKPFPHLAFPHSKGLKTPSKLPGFDGELMAIFMVGQSTPFPKSFPLHLAQTLAE